MKNQPTEILLSSTTPISQEEGLNLILSNIDDVFILLDKDLNIVTINENTKHKVQKYLGVTISIGCSILEIVAPERRTIMTELYKEVLKGKEMNSETELKFDDETKIFENHFKPARNTKGEIVGLVICSRDITEQKKSAEVLKEIEERWRFALEGSKQGVCYWKYVHLQHLPF